MYPEGLGILLYLVCSSHLELFSLCSMQFLANLNAFQWRVVVIDVHG